MKKDDMIEKREWSEFRELGLLWWINRILHAFGWAIVFDFDGDKVKSVYPARCKFRGFGEREESEGFEKIQKNFIQGRWGDK